MDVFQRRRKLGDVKPRATDLAQSETATGDSSAERQALEIEEPRRPLQISQCSLGRGSSIKVGCHSGSDIGTRFSSRLYSLKE